MKYVDTDKLIAEIERLLKCTELHRGEDVADGSRQTLYWIKDFISSLQQEQPEPSSNLIDADAVRDDFVTEVYRVLDADPTNDRANAIINAFDSLPTVLQDRPEVDYNKFEKLFDDFCESNKGHHITSHDACMWFWELGINTRKEE